MSEVRCDGCNRAWQSASGAYYKHVLHCAAIVQKRDEPPRGADVQRVNHAVLRSGGSAAAPGAGRGPALREPPGRGSRERVDLRKHHQSALGRATTVGSKAVLGAALPPPAPLAVAPPVDFAAPTPTTQPATPNGPTRFNLLPPELAAATVHPSVATAVFGPPPTATRDTSSSSSASGYVGSAVAGNASASRTADAEFWENVLRARESAYFSRTCPISYTDPH